MAEQPTLERIRGIVVELLGVDAAKVDAGGAFPGRPGGRFA